MRLDSKGQFEMDFMARDSQRVETAIVSGGPERLKLDSASSTSCICDALDLLDSYLSVSIIRPRA
jgi:hypothetical protein